MDPQICFQDIMVILNDLEPKKRLYHQEDIWDEFDGLMGNLWQWLDEGGFAPVVDSLGVAEYGPHEYRFRQTVSNSDRTLCIHTKKPDKRGWFEMVKYTHDGRILKSYDLR